MNPRHANRCSICNIDWPYNRNWAICPQCGEATAGIELLEPDRAWSELEAVNYCRQEGLDVPKGAEQVGKTKPAGLRRPAENRPTKRQVEADVANLRADLDAWADSPPGWAR